MLRSVHAKNGLILALALLGSIPYGVPAATSVLAGGVIQIVNLRGLERVVGWLSGVAPREPNALVQVVFGFRFLALFVSVGVVLWTLPVEPIPFTVGLSTAVPAVLWHGVGQRAGVGRDGA
jgi:hypothetical protein